MNMIAELLRDKIKNCGKSRYRICNETAIDKATLCRIMQGKSCKVETADRLFEYFGLTVVEIEQTRRK
jgi:hypothetical protein